MQPHRKRHSSLVAVSVIGVCLLFGFCSSVWTQETKKANAKLEELRREQLAVLEEIRDVYKKLFQSARIEYAEALASHREVFEAHLAFAKTHEDKMKACDEAMQDAQQFLETVKFQKQGARTTGLAVLKAQSYVLEIQIAREKLTSE